MAETPFARALARLTWSVRRAMRELGASQGAVSHWKAGRAIPPESVMDRLANEIERLAESDSDLARVCRSVKRQPFHNPALGRWRAHRAAQKEKAGL